MARSDTYTAVMTAEQFLFREIRIAAELYLKGTALDDAIATIREANLFQYPTERKISKMTRACWRRIEALGNIELVRRICDSPSNVARQINLYAIMKYNSLARSFMLDVIGKKYRCLDFTLTRRDVSAFFSDLQSVNLYMAAWSEATIKKLMGVFVKMLVETDYIAGARSETLRPVIICAELERGIIENGDTAALPAFNCFRQER